MSDPGWVTGLNTGLGALVEELARAQEGGGAVDWPTIMNKARALGEDIKSAATDYAGKIGDASSKLASASKQIQSLRQQVQNLQAHLPPMQRHPGMGQAAGGNQTVYISAGATAGIAAGALLLGGVGGYAAKAFLEGRKTKKAAEEAAKEDAGKLAKKK